MATVRLKVSIVSANEELVGLVNLGWGVLNSIGEDYETKKADLTYDPVVDNARYEERIDQWGQKVITALSRIFPTELESNLFLNPDIPFGAVSGDYKYQSLMSRARHFVRGLDMIRQTSLPQYTDLPMKERLYAEDIDSFSKVRDVNPSMVTRFLSNGFLDWPEDQVQLALEQILDVSFHKKDWGGEVNDLYTANVVVAGDRRATAFLLKGPGIGKKEMTIADCGKNGDQLVRLFTSPAELFIVQFVGRVAEMLIKDVEGKVRELRVQGKPAHFLILDGQDTARLLHAYGKLT